MPALAALALVGITAWLGATLAGADVAVVAALLLAVSPGLFALARYAILDTVFTAFLFGGAALVTVSALADRRRLQWAGYVLIALAVLTKGPLAIALCGLTFLLAIAMSGDARRRLLRLHWIAGLAIVVAIAAPWFRLHAVRWDRAFVEGYVLNENLRLFGTSMYAPAGLLVLLPDSRRRAAAVDRRCSSGASSTTCGGWSPRSAGHLRDPPLGVDGAVVGFFTLSTFKLDHYVFPAAPALCLLCARAWADVRARPLDPLNAGARVGLHLLGPLLVAVGAGGGYFLIVRLELPHGPRWPCRVVPVCWRVVTVRQNL